MQRSHGPRDASRQATVGSWAFVVVAALVLRRWSHRHTDVPVPAPVPVPGAAQLATTHTPARPASTSTLIAFAVLAALLWANAGANDFRFNVVLALVGSLPLAVLLVRAVVNARRAA